MAEAEEKAQLKTCTKCNEEKTIDNFHIIHRRGKTNYRSQCKTCANKVSQDYKNKNKEKVKKMQRLHYQNNKKKVKKKVKEYRDNNKEKIKEQKKEYREINKDTIKEKKKEYYENNKDDISKKHHQYYENNKDKIINKAKEYRDNNKEKINEQMKEYSQKNIENRKKEDYVPPTKQTCTKCNITKAIFNFSVSSTKVNGYKLICKKCCGIYYKDYYTKNRNVLILSAIRRHTNRLKTDPIYKKQCSYRSAFSKSFNRGKFVSPITRDNLGCSISFLKMWITYQFDAYMNWNNYGNWSQYWQIDHVFPCSSFDFTNEEDIKKCWHWSNLRPLSVKQNSKKSDNKNFTTTHKHELMIKSFLINSKILYKKQQSHKNNSKGKNE